MVWWSLGYLTQKVGMTAWISGDMCNTFCTQHIVFWDLTWLVNDSIFYYHSGIGKW